MKTKLVSPSKVDEIEQRIRKDLENRRYAPHERMRSERELAKLFRTPKPVVHSAIRRLVEKGCLYTKPRSGVFVSDRQQRASLSPPVFEEFPMFGMAPSRKQAVRNLAVSIPLESSPDQQEMWRRVIEAFHQEVRYLRINLFFNKSNESNIKQVDVVIDGPLIFHRMRPLFRPLDPAGPLGGILQGTELSPGILRLGQAVHLQYGLPVLRTSAMICINRTIFHRCGLAEDSLRTPIDLFRAGHRVEENLQGEAIGIGYASFYYFSVLGGIDFVRDQQLVRFDAQRLRLFLEQSRPYIKPHHLDSTKHHRWQNLAGFLDGHLAIFPWYLYNYPDLPEKRNELIQIRIPLEKGGFVPESCWLGGITQASACPEDAAVFLQFLVSRKAQEIFCHRYPHWLSVRTDVLEWQKGHSPFPTGAVHYEFDPRGTLNQTDPLLFDEYGPHLHENTTRFFTGGQDLETTIANLGHMPARQN